MLECYVLLLGVVKQLIEYSETQREQGLKHIEKLRKEASDLRKLLSQKGIPEDAPTNKIIDSLKEQLVNANTEITTLKQSIRKFSSQNVDQWAKLGKEIISLQLQLDRHKTLKDKKERELSFTRTIGKWDLLNLNKSKSSDFYLEKVTSEIGSNKDNKSTCSTPHPVTSRSLSKEAKNYSSDNASNSDSLTDIRLKVSKKSLTFKKKNISENIKPPSIPKSKVSVTRYTSSSRGRKIDQDSLTRNSGLDIIHSNSKEYHSMSESKKVIPSSTSIVNRKIVFKKDKNKNLNNKDLLVWKSSNKDSQTEISQNITSDTKVWFNPLSL